jgi:hypothetical protein
MIRESIEKKALDHAAGHIPLTGVLFSLVALVGVDFAASYRASSRQHRAVVSVVGVVGASDTAGIGAGPIVATAVLVLALLLWLGKRSIDAIPRSVLQAASAAKDQPLAAGVVQRRHSISYTSGGLYGP